MENASHQTAAARVCNIPELVDIIILHLAEGCSDLGGHEDALQRFKALFRLQRISKTFEASIVGSKGLRQSMLLESEPVAAEIVDINTVKCNPLLWPSGLKLVKMPGWRKITGVKCVPILDFDLDGKGPVKGFHRSKPNSFPAAYDALQKHTSGFWRKTLIWTAPLPIKVCVPRCCDIEA